MDSFTGKTQGETVILSVDFSKWLGTGEAILTTGDSAPTVTAAAYSGTDESPSGIIDGGATVNGSVVYQTITAGLIGMTYRLDWKIVTNSGETLIYSGLITIAQYMPR